MSSFSSRIVRPSGPYEPQHRITQRPQGDLEGVPCPRHGIQAEPVGVTLMLQFAGQIGRNGQRRGVSGVVAMVVHQPSPVQSDIKVRLLLPS